MQLYQNRGNYNLMSIITHALSVSFRKSEAAWVENVTWTSLLVLQMGNDGAVVKKEKKDPPLINCIVSLKALEDMMASVCLSSAWKAPLLGWDQAIDLVSEEHYIWLRSSGHFPAAL